MADPLKMDLTGLPSDTQGNLAVDLAGLPSDDDKDLRFYVESIFEQNRPVEGLKAGETPSFIKQVWRDIAEAQRQEVKAKGAAISEYVTPQVKEKINVTKQGFRQSVLGHAYRLGYEDKELDKIYKESFDQMGTVNRSLYQAGMVAGDLPIMAAGFVLGGGPASPVTAIGGAFALPAGLRKVYADRIEKGEIGTFKEFWERLGGAWWETMKGEATGVATGKIGLSVGAFKLPAEIVTMTAAGAALEGRVPEPQEFLDTAIIIGGLHATARFVPVLTNIYKKTGKRPAEVLKDIETDPSIKDDIMRAAEDNVSEAMPVMKDVGVPEVDIPTKDLTKLQMTKEEFVKLEKLKSKKIIELPTEKAIKREQMIREFGMEGEKIAHDVPTWGMTDKEVREWGNRLAQPAIKEYNEALSNFQKTGKTGLVSFSLGKSKQAIDYPKKSEKDILAHLKDEMLRLQKVRDDLIKSHEIAKEKFINKDTGKWILPEVIERYELSVKESPKPSRIPLEGGQVPTESPPGIPKSYLHLVEEKLVSDEPGAAPQTRQRKFLKTVAEADKTKPELAEKVKEVDPQEYVVEPNVESLVKAETRIETDGLEKTIDYALSDAELNAEKGATFITLMDKFQKDGDIERALQMTEAYDQQLREAGRFIQAASIWTKASPAGFMRWAEKQLEATRSKFGWLDTLFKRRPQDFTLNPEERKIIMERMAEMQEMPEGIEKTDAMLQLIDMVAKKVPPSVTELIDAYRYQNMLSSPRTQMRNIGENLMNTFLTKPIDVTTRGAMDFVKAGLFGKERQAYISDVPLYMKTAINAVPNALNAFMSVMRVEKGVEIGKPDIGIDVKSEFQRARMAQIPKPLTIVGRFMEASDKFFSTLIGAGEFATQIKNGATEAQAYARASELSEKYLYRDKLDPKDPDHLLFAKGLISLGKLMQESRKYPVIGPISKWAVPFLTTPLNKGARMIERSAVGGLEVGIRTLFGQKVKPEVYARAVSGTLVTALATFFVMQGQTTWTAPSDPEAKRLFYESGRKPFSILIGENWVPIWYLGPYAFAFGVPMAIKHYTQDDKTAMTEGAFDKILAVSEGLVRFIGSQTSTQSIGTLFSALSGDIDFTFPSTAAFTSSQIIPLTSLIRYINTMIDPVFRKPATFFESAFKDIPILSKRLESIKESSGKEARRDPRNYIIPYDIGKDDPKVGLRYKASIFEVRRNYIKSKMANTIKKVQEGKIKPEEMPDELNKIFKGMSKLK